MGLVQAFKIAGARSIIGSLWKLDDERASEFMQHFYYGLRKLGIREAFAQATTTMRERYPDNPRYWAGFVLID